MVDLVVKAPNVIEVFSGGQKGESFVDGARRVGAINGLAVPANSTDAQVYTLLAQSSNSALAPGIALSRAYANADTNVPIEGATSTADRGAKYWSGLAGVSSTAATDAKNLILNNVGFQAVSADLAGSNTIGAVSAKLAQIQIIAAITGDVTTVAGISTKVTTVANSITNINLVASDIALGSSASFILRSLAAGQQAVSAQIATAAYLQQVQQLVSGLAVPTGIYKTKAEAVADLANIAANATVSITRDESQNNFFTTYKKVGGVLVYQVNVLPPAEFNRANAWAPGNHRGTTWVLVGDSRTIVSGVGKLSPTGKGLVDLMLFDPGCPYEGASYLNMGSNGQTAAGWALSIANGDKNQAPQTYYGTNNDNSPSNYWQVANAKPNKVRIQLLTNDGRLRYNSYASTYAAMEANLTAGVLFLLANTDADIELVMPPPYPFLGYPDPTGYTDCLNQADADERSLLIANIYRRIASWPSNRIKMIDTHRLVYGETMSSLGTDLEGQPGNLLVDTLHSGLGYIREIQCEAKLADPSLPYLSSHMVIPQSIMAAQAWGKAFRFGSGVNGQIGVDWNPQRRGGDMPLGSSTTLEGLPRSLRNHLKADALADAGALNDAFELDWLQGVYFYFPRTKAITGPHNLAGGTAADLNAQRYYGIPGTDFSSLAITGITNAMVTNGVERFYAYVTDRKNIPGAGETQHTIPIVLQGVQPLRAFSGTITTTNGSPLIDVTAATQTLSIGSRIKATGIPLDAVVAEMPLGTVTVTTNTGSNIISVSNILDGVFTTGARIFGPNIPQGAVITGGSGGSWVMSINATVTSSNQACTFRANGGVGRYMLTGNATATATGVAATCRPSGAAKLVRSTGRPYRVTRGVGLRNSQTGSVVIDVYHQASAIGDNGAITYPGKRMGTANIQSVNRVSTVTDWVQDEVNYPLPTNVALTGGGFTTAAVAGTVTISGGAITAIAVANGGSGYTSPPVVTITKGGGTGATATAVLTGGVVTGFTIDNGGSSYTNTTFPNGPTMQPGDPITVYAELVSGVLGDYGRVDLVMGG